MSQRLQTLRRSPLLCLILPHRWISIPRIEGHRLGGTLTVRSIGTETFCWRCGEERS